MSAARLHPPAVVQRQQQRDFLAFSPVLEGLSDRQCRLLLLLGGFIARHVPEDFQNLCDDDIADAVATLAATLETAARGVIYEHRASTRPAQHLADELARVVDEVGRDPGLGHHAAEGSVIDGQAGARAPVFDDAAMVLRRIERSAREMAAKLSGGPTGYRDLLARLLGAAEQGSGTPTRASGLIVP